MVNRVKLGNTHRREHSRASLRSPTLSGPSAPQTHSFVARVCCLKYQLELPAEEAKLVRCARCIFSVLVHSVSQLLALVVYKLYAYG